MDATFPLFQDESDEFSPTERRSSRSSNRPNSNSTNRNNSAPNEQGEPINVAPPRLVINEVDETLLAEDSAGIESDTVKMVLNTNYIQSCAGMMRVLQIIMSLVTLVVLTTMHGHHYKSYLLLPNHTYYRCMIFVLVFSMLTSSTLLFVYVCGLTKNIPYNWPLIDWILHGFIALLYVIGSTLIVCTHDFYNPSKTPYTPALNNHLLVVVVMGYVTMIVYLLTSIHGYQKWRRVIQNLLNHQSRKRSEAELYTNSLVHAVWRAMSDKPAGICKPASMNT